MFPFNHVSSQARSVPPPEHLPDPLRIEQKEIERVFARLFASEDGKKVLAWLQMLTFQRALGPSAPDAQLRYQEGQRALMATILRLIDRGRDAS